MDEIGILLLVAFVAVPVAICIWWWHFQRKRVERARRWPRTEAIIESGTLKELRGQYSHGLLPLFTFSYKVAGEYYSGQFALTPYISDPGPSIVERIAGRKLNICYDPGRPERWFIPDELLEGCRVQQEIGPHVLRVYVPD
jgi:hypothetical protein